MKWVRLDFLAIAPDGYLIDVVNLFDVEERRKKGSTPGLRVRVRGTSRTTLSVLRQEVSRSRNVIDVHGAVYLSPVARIVHDYTKTCRASFHN